MSHKHGSKMWPAVAASIRRWVRCTASDGISLFAGHVQKVCKAEFTGAPHLGHTGETSRKTSWTLSFGHVAPHIMVSNVHLWLYSCGLERDRHKRKVLSKSIVVPYQYHYNAMLLF